MSKTNIQTATRELKDTSQDILKQIKDVQEEVHRALTTMRAAEKELLDQQKQEQQRSRAEEMQPVSRMTAYVMPDDQEANKEPTQAAPTKPNAAPEPKKQMPANVVPMGERRAQQRPDRPRQEQRPGGPRNDSRSPAPQRRDASNNRPNGTNKPGTGTGVRRDRDTADVTVMPQKERTHSRPNKTQYNNNVDRRVKNKKAAIKETPPPIAFDDERMGSRKRKNKRMQPAKQYIEPIKIDHAVITTEFITVKDLSEKIGKPASEIIKKLFLLGIMATINQELDFDTCELIASEYNITLEQNVAKTAEEVMTEAAEIEDDADSLVARPPVVTIMGHVDHGKTSLLDAIRKSQVTEGEAGGITQHIGAYMVDLHGRPITFLDTPGHEAFTAMRARGAQATDIAILVVAADDGIMPQTIEAINHAKAAEVPIIVAINKMDKPDANPNRVMEQLTQEDLVVEEWGGDVIAVPISAKTGEGLDKLLEMILLVADVEDLRANPNRMARGLIIEAQLDKGRGPVATVLIQNGTLHVGDNIIAGTASGRVRAMMNDRGERVQQATPSEPVEVLGFSEVPDAGDLFNAVDSDRFSRIVAQERRDKIKAEKIQTAARVSLDNLFSQIAEGQVKELNVIIKADVQGSVEALKQSLEKLSNDEVRVRAIHGGVGAITVSDILFASASNAIIIGFNVRPNADAREAAEKEGVDMRLYRVIYNAIEDIEKAMKGMLEPVFREDELGQAEVRNTFKVTGVGTIAGCYVKEGKIVRNAQIRLVRDGIVVHEGTIASLRRFKEDVKEVASGYECGIGIENFNDVKEGDSIEAFEMVEIEQ